MSEEQKKQIPLRVSSELFAAIAKWAEDDFRSINGQIEFLLTECVRYRRKHHTVEMHENDNLHVTDTDD